MGNKEKDLLKKAIGYFHIFSGAHSDRFVFHDYISINNNVFLFKEIAKAEGIQKEEYGLGLVALVLSDLGIADATDKEIDNTTLVNNFIEVNEINEDEAKEIFSYIEFFKTNRQPKNLVEEVLRDTKYIHLGLPDALEKLELLRVEEEKTINKRYTELEWLEKCKLYFITHSFDSNYANRKFGVTRSRNYFELEKRIDKLRSEDHKEKKGHDSHADNLTDKEGEDMFKLAFRNSVNLIAVADRKAGMLIQINTLLAGVVFTFGVNKFEVNPFYIVPTATVLVGSALTVFFGVLASKPSKRSFYEDAGVDKENFFFGSFDKLDPAFRHVSWENYSTNINKLLKGNKKFVFEELIKESYQVRKVLSKKFSYLSIAYKIFFAGLLLGILGFLALLIYEYNYHEIPASGVVSETPF